MCIWDKLDCVMDIVFEFGKVVEYSTNTLCGAKESYRIFNGYRMLLWGEL